MMPNAKPCYFKWLVVVLMVSLGFWIPTYDTWKPFDFIFCDCSSHHGSSVYLFYLFICTMSILSEFIYISYPFLFDPLWILFFYFNSFG